MLALLLVSSSARAVRPVPGGGQPATPPFRRALLANERFSNTLTTAATAIGPFFPPAGNALAILASAVPALRSAGVPLPGCTACPVEKATPLQGPSTTAINNGIIALNDMAIVLQPGQGNANAVRFFRQTGTRRK